MFLPVHRIIPFSNVEGIGNRSSIFVQGCNANCLYCHNSETIPKKYDNIKRYNLTDLCRIIEGHIPFIRGITVSGGEPTLYHVFLIELFKEVHKLGLSCYIDTNGFFNLNKLESLVDVTDKFLFDVKAVGSDLDALCFSEKFLTSKSLDHKSLDYTQHNNHLMNLKKLLALGKIEEVRHVYTKGFYDEKALIKLISDILKPYPDMHLRLIRVHDKGLPEERAALLKESVPSLGEFKELCSWASTLD